MAMQAGVGLSRILILAGAGYTGTIMMRNGKLSDILGELQSVVKGMERSEGDYDDSDAVASQVRRLAMEVRQLASSRQITVMDGVSGAANLQALVVPAAVLGALGYGYMWWKGLSFTDLMYVTKANMATAVANLTKNLEQVSVTLAAAKRHLTQKIQSMDDKVEEHTHLSKGIKNEVTLAREDINSLESELASLNTLISGLDGKLDTLEYKQDVTNVCMLHLYNYFGGKSAILPDMVGLLLNQIDTSEQLQLPVNQKARNLLADVETKGLKNLAEELLESNGTEEGGATTVKIIGLTKSNDKSRPLLSRFDELTNQSCYVSLISKDLPNMGSLDLPRASSFKGGSENFLRDVLESILKTYLRKNPMAKTVWELVQSVENEKVSYDHFFFRTFKVDGYGIDSLSTFFMDYGYTIGGRLDFPKKNIHVLWLSPPEIHVPGDGHGLGNGPLPRIVIAELLVDELSPISQEIIRKYLKPEGGKQAILSSTLGSLIWEKPTSADFNQLAKESEYGAWALFHGYTLNHLAFAVHRLKHRFSDIKCVEEYFKEKGFELNKDGGDVLKVSEDGLLLQVSLMSEKHEVEFADGVTETITASYIEFVQRLVLPEFKDVPGDEIKEFHRREGLEKASAYHIMESTRFTAQD